MARKLYDSSVGIKEIDQSNGFDKEVIMRHMFKSLIIAVVCGIFVADLSAQSTLTLESYKEILSRMEKKSNKNQGADSKIFSSNAVKFVDGSILIPESFIGRRPIFTIPMDVSMAMSVKAHELWSGGVTGYSLSGKDVVIGVWESGGYPNKAHNSFVEADGTERVVYADHIGGPLPFTSHSMDVNSIIGSEGDPSPDLRGIAHQATLWAFTSGRDSVEVAAAAEAGLRVSNHSYGSAAGWWATITPGGAPEPLRTWLGDPSVSRVEDYFYGFYDNKARYYDQITHDNKYYSLVVAVGNDRGTAAPDDPRHYVYTGTGQYSGWEESSEFRLGDNHDNGGYDTILGGFQSSKNTISVGSTTNDDNVACRVRNEPAFETAYYSAWGPTDDGRIKPDFSAPGMAFYRPVYSDIDGYNCAGAAGGTSYAAPIIAAGIGLLIEHQENIQSSEMRTAASHKALMAHTAEDLGRPGPDYNYGWGLPNFKQAADLMSADKDEGFEFHIFEKELFENGEDFYYIVSDGSPLKATLAWTDPPGPTLDTFPSEPNPQWLDNTTPNLVNDLDVVILDPEGNGTYYFPWKLDPSVPDAPATMAVDENLRPSLTNNIDVMEQVIFEAPVEGKKYRVIVSHKNELNSHSNDLLAGSQDYSLILTGIADVSLPVELSSFEIVETKHGVELKWTTQSEVNNAGFEIERKLDGQFESIAFVEGQGTTTETTNYQFYLDGLPYGIQEYRLKQVDHDGSTEFSDVLSYLHEVDSHIELSEPFPNPFNPRTSVSLVLKDTQVMKVELFDLNGRLVSKIFEGRLDGHKRHQFEIDGSSLPSAQYVLRASGESFTEVKSLLLVR